MKVLVSDGLMEPAAFPRRPGLMLSGDAVSRPGLPPEKSTLEVWQHELTPGAEIRLTQPEEDHVFYVLRGAMRVGDAEVGECGAMCVGRNAEATLQAGREGAAVVHYLGDAATRPDKPGGCVHILPEKGILYFEDSRGGFNRIAILYADSDCPNCSVWLHKQNNQAGKFTFPHSHSADEVISVLDGELMLGTRALTAGSAVAVAKNAFYSFTTGPSGLVFLNFRQDDPSHLRKGEDPSKAKLERDMWRGAVRTAASLAAVPATT